MTTCDESEPIYFMFFLSNSIFFLLNDYVYSAWGFNWDSKKIFYKVQYLKWKVALKTQNNDVVNKSRYWYLCSIYWERYATTKVD